MTYGATNSVHVTIKKEENAKGELYTTSVSMYDKDGFQFELSKNEAHTLYKILSEIEKDGHLKCTY